MSDDRALLEAAARAAGYVLFWGITDPMIECKEEQHPTKTHNLWNPLADDGDALRLAVKLNVWPVLNRYEGGDLIAVQRGEEYWGALAEEPIGTDPYAATRSAIVRAAAAMAP